MNIDTEHIESKLAELNDLIAKTSALLHDSKICESDITKTLIASAVKKYVGAISDFKIEFGE
jgi:hypothetical protein